MLFGTSFIITMRACRLERLITTYLPLPKNLCSLCRRLSNFIGNGRAVAKASSFTIGNRLQQINQDTVQQILARFKLTFEVNLVKFRHIIIKKVLLTKRDPFSLYHEYLKPSTYKCCSPPCHPFSGIIGVRDVYCC